MPDILLGLEYTTKEDVLRCINAYKRMPLNLTTQKSLNITAQKKMKEIDISLIAYFILFAEEEDGPEITIRLPYNHSTDEVARTLKCYGTFAYLMTGKSVFNIIFDDSEVNFSLDNSIFFPDDWFILPDDYLPLLYFNKENPELFELIFESGLDTIDFFE